MSTGPRHVLLTTDAVGGVWTYALELSGALAARGVAVSLAVLGPAPTSAQAASAPDGVTLIATDLPLDWTAPDTASLNDIATRLAVLARGVGADLVELHSPALLGDAHWPAPVVAVAHSCPGTWWEAVRGDAPVPTDFVWRMAAMARGLDAAQTVIAPSQSLADALQRVYGVRRQIDIVHNGRAPRTAEAVKSRHGVLAAGRLWDEGKNIAVLDQAAAMMPLAVRTAGPVQGPNGAAIKLRAVGELGILDEACMARACDEARVFASPALYEPFGLAVLEAAQAGLPLVLADIPTFRELWDGAALFLPARAPGAWARALTNLHDDAAERTRLGSAAQARAERYGSAAFETKMWRLLGQTLSDARAAA